MKKFFRRFRLAKYGKEGNALWNDSVDSTLSRVTVALFAIATLELFVWTLTGLISVENIGLGLVGGLIVGFTVATVNVVYDVSALTADTTRTRTPLFAILGRSLIALFFAFVTAVPFEMGVLHADIMDSIEAKEAASADALVTSAIKSEGDYYDGRITVERQTLATSFEEAKRAGNADLDAKTKQREQMHDKMLAKHATDKKALQDAIANADRLIAGEAAGKYTGRRGIGPVVRAMQKSKAELSKQLKELQERQEPEVTAFEKKTEELLAPLREKRDKDLAAISSLFGPRIDKLVGKKKQTHDDIREMGRTAEGRDKLAAKYDGSWREGDRGFVHRFTELTEMAEKDDTIAMIIWAIRIFLIVLSLIPILTKLIQSEEVKQYFSVGNQAAAGNEQARQSLFNKGFDDPQAYARNFDIPVSHITRRRKAPRSKLPWWKRLFRSKNWAEESFVVEMEPVVPKRRIFSRSTAAKQAQAMRELFVRSVEDLREYWERWDLHLRELAAPQEDDTYRTGDDIRAHLRSWWDAKMLPHGDAFREARGLANSHGVALPKLEGELQVEDPYANRQSWHLDNEALKALGWRDPVEVAREAEAEAERKATAEREAKAEAEREAAEAKAAAEARIEAQRTEREAQRRAKVLDAEAFHRKLAAVRTAQHQLEGGLRRRVQQDPTASYIELTNRLRRLVDQLGILGLLQKLEETDRRIPHVEWPEDLPRPSEGSIEDLWTPFKYDLKAMGWVDPDADAEVTEAEMPAETEAPAEELVDPELQEARASLLGTLTQRPEPKAEEVETPPEPEAPADDEPEVSEAQPADPPQVPGGDGASKIEAFEDSFLGDESADLQPDPEGAQTGIPAMADDQAAAPAAAPEFVSVGSAQDLRESTDPFGSAPMPDEPEDLPSIIIDDSLFEEEDDDDGEELSFLDPQEEPTDPGIDPAHPGQINIQGSPLDGASAPWAQSPNGDGDAQTGEKADVTVDE